MTITVACKLPSGLTIEHGGKKLELEGSHGALSVGGYGLTKGVDEDFFNGWLLEHEEFAPVKAGLIFAQPTADRAADQAREMRDVRNGMEGLNPHKPADGVEPTDETKKALAELDPEAPTPRRGRRANS